MSKGAYLAIGVNSISLDHYGTTGDLLACENDAQDMATIAEHYGMSGTTLLTADATSTKFIAAIKAAAASLEEGDLFVLSYSGHGSQIRDTNGDEPDGYDETWCLYDRMVVDDELYALWARFKPGVRILLLSDSCNSGSINKAVFANIFEAPGVVRRIKFLNRAVATHVFKAHKEMYTQIQQEAGPADKSIVQASVLLISGSQDDQSSLDGDPDADRPNSAFTQALRATWNQGLFAGNYRSFRDAIASAVNSEYQVPNYSVVGTPSPAFEAQTPFSV